MTRGVAAEIKPKRFPTDTIELKEDFLRQKVAELLPEKANPSPAELIPAFLRINRDQRKAAEQTKRQARRPQPVTRPLWEGAFVQPRNTKVFSNLAEDALVSATRGARWTSRCTSASTSPPAVYSPVPAANVGVVVFAAPLTIYGNTVVLDHGWGLQTLVRSPLLVRGQGRRLREEGTGARAHQQHRPRGGRSPSLRSPDPWHPGRRRWSGGTPAGSGDHIGRPLRDASLPATDDRRRAVRRRGRPRGGAHVSGGGRSR